MEFRVERGPDKVAGFLTFVVIDMIGKTNILEVKQLDCGFPYGERSLGTSTTNYFPKMLFFPKIVYL
jgi:hypothetical protein